MNEKMFRCFFEVGHTNPLKPVRITKQLIRTISRNFSTTLLTPSHNQPTTTSDEPTSPAPLPSLISINPGNSLEGTIVSQFPHLSADELPESAWIFCLPNGLKVHSKEEIANSKLLLFNFVMTNVTGQQKFITCLCFLEKLNPNLYANLSSSSLTPSTSSAHSTNSSIELFVPKCYCLMSVLPCWQFSRQWLIEYHKICVLNNNAASSNDLISSLLSFQIPSPGNLSSPFKIGNADLPLIKASQNNGLPFMEVSFYWLFHVLGISNVLKIFEWLLNEEKIVLYSKNITLLETICESLASLLFPFKWPFLYITLLPKILLDYIQSPLPFIIGIQQSAIKSINPTDLPQGVLIIDLDSNCFCNEKDLPKPELQLPSDNSTSMLYSDIQESWNLLHELDSFDWNSWETPSKEKLELFQISIRASFIKFFAFHCKNHRDFLYFFRVIPKPHMHFSSKAFAQSCNSKFMELLSQKQFFISFFEERPFPFKDIFDIAIENKIWAMSLRDTATFIKNIENGAIPLSEFSAIVPISLKPTVEIDHKIENIIETVIPGLITDTAEQSRVTQLRFILKQNQYRRKFLWDLTNKLSTLQPPWEISQKAFPLLGDFVDFAFSESISQSDFISANCAIKILQLCFCTVNQRTQFLYKRLHHSELFESVDLWIEIFVIRLHNTISKSYEIKSHIIPRWNSLTQEEITDCTSIEWDNNRTVFVLACTVMLEMEVPIKVIKKLIPIVIHDFDNEKCKHLLEFLPAAAQIQLRKEDTETETDAIMIKRYEEAKYIILWVDDKIAQPFLQENIAKAKSEAFKTKKWKIEIVELHSSKLLKDWLDKFGSHFSQKIRVVTNRCREFDGGDMAFQRVIDLVHKGYFPDVDILIFCGKRDEVEKYVQGKNHVFIASHPSGFYYFCSNAKL